jgi:peptide/nickel transport system substrate-binding protein
MKGANASQSLPFLDKLTLQYYSSEATTRSAFVAGQADDYPITYLDPSVLKEVLSARPDVYVTVNSLWATYPVMFFWNYANKLFQDVRVRRALSMAIDRETLMKNVYSGAAVPGGAPVAFDLLGESTPPPLSEYGPYYQYDPKGAQALMKEAGYENGFKIQWEVDNRTQQLTQFQVYKGVQQYWQQNLKVEVDFVIKDPLTVTNDALNSAFPDLMEQTAVTGYDAYSLTTPLVHTGGGGNRGKVSDATLDGLLDKLGAATSPDSVLSLTKQVLQRMQDQVTYIWLGWPQAATLTQPWLHGQSQNLYAYNFYFGIENMRSNWIDQTAPGGRGGKPV